MAGDPKRERSSSELSESTDDVHTHHHDGHHHHGHHHHGHRHHGHALGNAKRLIAAFFLIAFYTVAEALGGLYTGSLALLADAGHMLSDVAALGIAVAAVLLARRPASSRRTFGFYRAEVLGALINSVVLIGISIFIFVEAVERFREPPEVLGGSMLLIAVGGLLVNLTGLLILGDGHQHSLNVRGAWLHMLADTLGSVGAIVSAVLIWQFDWRWADPAASMGIGCLVMVSALALLRETVRVLMEATPVQLDLRAVEESMLEVEGVVSIHDLHAWTIGSSRDALTAHVVVASEHDHILARLQEVLRQGFGLEHVTLQLERERCDLCCCDDTECVFEAAGRDTQHGLTDTV